MTVGIKVARGDVSRYPNANSSFLGEVSLAVLIQLDREPVVSSTDQIRIAVSIQIYHCQGAESWEAPHNRKGAFLVVQEHDQRVRIPVRADDIQVAVTIQVCAYEIISA